MKKSVAASEKPVKAKEFDKELFKRSVEYNVRTLYRKNLEEADAQQIFQAVSYAIKDRIVENWMETQKAYEKEDPKMVYYMSMEFLMGRALGNNLINLKAYKPVAEALEELGLDLNLIEDRSRMQHWVTVDWDVWQHVSWILWQRWDILHMAAVSVIVMVCSSRRSATVIR